MKIIYNNIIPFPGYIAINLLGVLFVRKKYEGKLNKVDINHETIHTEQMKELCFLPFYIIYIFEWLFRFLFTKDMWSHQAYRNISFEQEAYANQKNMTYLDNRKHFSQWRKRSV